MQPLNYMQQWKQDMLNSLASPAPPISKVKWPDQGKEEEKNKLAKTDSFKDLLN